MSQSILFRMGGAISRLPDDATAASHRDAPYMWHPIAAWSDPADTEHQINWVRESSAAIAPYGTGGVYLNFEQDEGEAHVRAGYSAEKYARLVELKDKYDPQNRFRFNQNIAPSGAAAS
jgi:FAD/FMN-containing dehydrogenase